MELITVGAQLLESRRVLRNERIIAAVVIAGVSFAGGMVVAMHLVSVAFAAGI